ncbi:hypothetical protein GQ44DRAFT_767395 [Phaeosphaeriaceae sp. PMI808]|nr:hypothetical protein GQ44DRAFT_767395 [Phaeosphaeriaceae sp. PMI808]
MNHEQTNRLTARIRDLEARFDSIEQRLDDIERVITTGAGEGALPNRGRGRTVPGLAPGASGTMQNANFLPFAIEYIASKRERKHPNDDRRCGCCQAPTFSINCFRYDHFRWCREHHRPILPPHSLCGRDYENCVQVKWVHYRDWEMIVQMSYAANLGQKGVSNLNSLLFPIDLYPGKYDANGEYVG